MAHIVAHADLNGDVWDQDYYCSDHCAQYDDDYAGWNGAHEIDHCTNCPVFACNAHVPHTGDCVELSVMVGNVFKRAYDKFGHWSMSATEVIGWIEEELDKVLETHNV